jgi:uncharacterized membrane protein YkvA (DUF1232 family)
MSEDQTKYLDTFPSWLRSLGDDAEALAALLPDGSIPVGARELVAGGVNYLFKSLDLIPDGIDDIGYLDDAFVLRVAADLASQEDLPMASESVRIIGKLTNDCELLRAFLGSDYDRLEAYVRSLRKGAARGRSVADVLGDASTQSDFLADVEGFARGFEAPSFAKEEKNLIKLKAFFDAKLPK